MNTQENAIFYKLVRAAINGAEQDGVPANELGHLMTSILFPDEVEYPTREAAKLLNRAPGTLQRWRTEGRGPKYIRDGMRNVVYTRKAIRAYQLGDDRVGPVRPLPKQQKPNVA